VLPPVSLPAIVVLFACLTAAIMDLWKFRVYNVLTLPLLLSGILFHSLTQGAEGMTVSLLGALFGLGVLVPFCLLGGMGAGDVKLLAGVGAWLGTPTTFVVFLLSGLVGGVYALFLIIARGRVRETRANLQILWLRMAAVGRLLGAEDQVEIDLSCPDRRWHLIPFGVMVAFGVVILLVCVWVGSMR
jgi:prepilin peptidase CpaA